MKNNLEASRRTPGSLWDMMNEFDEIFEQFRNPRETSRSVAGRPGEGAWFEPQAEIQEGEQAYFLNLDLPGMKTEDVKIDLNGRVLTISGERRQANEIKNGRVHRVERSYGKFSRSFGLPENVDAEKVQANMENGVLNITLPKTELSRNRRIEIQGSKAGEQKPATEPH